MADKSSSILAQHHEVAERAPSPVDPKTEDASASDDVVGYETDVDGLPPGYFRSRFFLGSMLAVGLGLCCAVASFAYASPILGAINADLGPDARYLWVALVYNTVLAVGLALVGRLTDIFGRRYWFVGGGVVGVAGAAVCATARSVPVLVGGNVLLGLASSTQMSFHFVMGELVPMRYRYAGNALLYVCCLPGSGVAPSIAFAFLGTAGHGGVGWRGIYWLLLALEAAALVCWVLFYFPPSFAKKHRDDGTADDDATADDTATKSYWIRHFDYVGAALFAGGFVVFLLGLSWGGSAYPWRSPAPICAIVLGAATLAAFVAWECWAPVREPLVPMHLFANRDWVVSCVLLALGAGVYYAFAIIWPSQAAVLYSRPGDLAYTGGISNLVGLAVIAGQVTGGLLARPLGHTRRQCQAVLALGGLFLACVAVGTPDNRGAVMALLTLGCFCIGWNESLCLANATLCVHDQRAIGVAGGLAGSIRAAVCAVLVAIYTTVLANRLATTVAATVPPALAAAGLPTASVPAFLAALAAGATADALAAVPGATAAVVAAGTRAYQEANAAAYRTVYLTTIAFSAVAVALAFFAPNTDKYMTGKVVATLHNEGGKTEKRENTEA